VLPLPFRTEKEEEEEVRKDVGELNRAYAVSIWEVRLQFSRIEEKKTLACVAHRGESRWSRGEARKKVHIRG
jgi:hypothetical protein